MLLREHLPPAIAKENHLIQIQAGFVKKWQIKLKASATNEIL